MVCRFVLRDPGLDCRLEEVSDDCRARSCPVVARRDPGGC